MNRCDSTCSGDNASRTRLFINELNTARGIVSENMDGHDRNENNQEDAELYLPDDDSDDLNELAAETSSLVFSDSSSFVCSEQNTITAVRVRPMLPSEKKNGYRIIVDVSANNSALVTKIVNPTSLPPSTQKLAPARYTSRKLPLELTPATGLATFPAQFTQEFWFDYSYWSFGRSGAQQVATQGTIYDELGVLALQTLLQGHNCSVFAYGQPGAGKTYTMMGSSGERALFGASVRSNNNDVEAPNALFASERRGLIPRLCQGLFAEIDEGKRAGIASTVIMSYVEIYDERVYDLLSQSTVKKSLKVREHPEDGAFVERAQRVRVTSPTELLKIVEEGNRTRSAASCLPCRPHTVLTISLTQNASGDDTPRKSKLCLVDLAGSERVDHSETSGLRLREAASVNRSLATLADVVGALAKRKINRSADQHQKTFVPYRNSVLTRLLKDCLGGRAKTIMIGAISPCCAHYEESISTLRYIERARSIYSTGRLQTDTGGDLTQRFLGEVNELQLDLCASDESSIPLVLPNDCCGTPECHNECPDCETCDLPLGDNNNPDLTPLKAQVKETTGDGADITMWNQDRSTYVDTSVCRAKPERQVKNVHLLNLVAIRRRWQTLRQYRALERWRKFVSSDRIITRTFTEDIDNDVEDNKISRIWTSPAPVRRKSGCPPLHTRIPITGGHKADRVQDVVAAVVATDAICCSVVQEFLFSGHPETPKVLLQPSNPDAASLLELLASSSEFDRSEFRFTQSEANSNDEPQLEELTSPKKWTSIEDSELNVVDLHLEMDVESNEDVEHLLPPESLHDERPAHSTLSLCMDSIDMARRALGPGVHNLRPTRGTGVEYDLLRYLDKKFIAMTQNFEDLVANLQWTPSRSICEALEAATGEFCLQIIARLCDQLPSASSACVAGRLQLESQLERFGNCLKQQLLPEIARGLTDEEANENGFISVCAVVTDLLVMTERITLVWTLVGHKKRERLLQAQALEATTIKEKKMAAKIETLKERNVELSAKCAVLVATNASLDDSMDVKLKASPSVTLDKNLGVKLAMKVTRTRDVQALHDELLYRLATLNQALTASSARVTELEAENARFSTGISPADYVASNMSTRTLKLQAELDDSRDYVEKLKHQLIELKRINLEQRAELENIKADLSFEKEARSKADSDAGLLRTRTSELENQLAHAEVRFRELEEAEAVKIEENLRRTNAALASYQEQNAELSAFISQVEIELSSALEKSCRAESVIALQAATIENQTLLLKKVQTQREVAEMRAEDLSMKCAVLVDSVAIQTNQVSALENRLFQDKQHSLEKELSLTASVQDRDELVLLLSQTEEALASALNREKRLQSQLVGPFSRESEDMNRVRGELHETTLELASLREELAELLDHSTLQSATVDSLKLEQDDALQKIREFENERDNLVLQCRKQQCVSEQKDRKYLALTQGFAEKLSNLERQQEIEREECMAIHEAFQRQTSSFQKIQARQHSIKMDYCSTIRDLKGQVETLAAESRVLTAELVTNAHEVETTRVAARFHIEQIEAQTKLSVLNLEDLALKLTRKLHECKQDLKATIENWIRAETQCGLQRVCIQRLNSSFLEAKESCMMQLAETESSCLREDTGQDFPIPSESKLVVSDHLSSLDAWFDEVISGNQEVSTLVNIVPETHSKARDEDSAARSSLLQTLTDLSALTNELLVVCESASDSEIRPNNSFAEESGRGLEHYKASEVADDQQVNKPEKMSSEAANEMKTTKQKEKTSSEVTQLRKIVMKLKEALDAKDDMLLFLHEKIQLGGANDGLCHFLSLGGFEMLLDCGIKMQSLQRRAKQGGGSIYRLQLPGLSSVDVGALDVVLLSNHHTLLALPLLTEVLGFKGQIYATQLTLDFGRLFLEELASLARDENDAIFTFEAVADGLETEMPMFSLKEIEKCCKKVQCVEYSEVVPLAYGVQVTALSSGYSLGASIWLVEGPNDRLAYVAAASGDYNRHPKELDLLPLVDCETLLLTDLKPDRDPHSNTERMVERVLSGVTRVLERGGVCIVPTSPCGVVFDLVEAVYTACIHNKQNVPMYFISDYASRVMELTQLGAEWLCEKKIEKLYAGEDAFLHESLQKNNLFHAVADVSAATAATFQNGSILFVGHPSLKFGLAPQLIQMLGNESRNAIVLIDPSVDATEAFAPFRDLQIEQIACPIDPRLSCGDANQFIARCCPHNLIIPYEYTIAPPATAVEGADMSSHFSRVLPLHELTAAKTKTELLTFPMKPFEPIVVEKTSKYLDGRLDPKLAAQATITEVNGKAAACVSGVLNVKRKSFVLEPSPDAFVAPSSADVSEDAKLKGTGKRKASSLSDADTNSTLQSIDYKEKSNLLLGRVDEDKLMKQVKTHDPQAQVYISQGQGDADVFMSIPSLDARVTLWKEAGKTLVETEKEEARALLTSFILAQLNRLLRIQHKGYLPRLAAKMERIEDGSSMNIVPPMFHAGISSKFTKRHGGNFRDTTLTAASAAKQRAELKLERQADAIEKQQQKIDKEMKKIAEITQNLHRQQLREAKRLRSRLNYSASKIQIAFRRHLAYVNRIRRDAAVVIQTLSRRFLARQFCWRLRLEREEGHQNCSSRIISRCIRRFAARNIRCREIERQYWAACSIQSMIRVAAARSYVQEQRRQRQEAELQHRAAIVIQCNARSFMTRLIYLDVLYLICRIQAVMRGCLVRRQLRWLRVSDVDAITKLQAHIRGFLARKHMECRNSGDHNTTRSCALSSRSTQKVEQATQADFGVSTLKLERGGFRTSRASSFSFANGERMGKNGIPSLVRSSTGRGWQPSTEPVIKRSYWLPAGASFDKRLPVLPIPQRMKALDQGNPLRDELGLINRSWTPKKRPHQKPCPVRLSPVVIPTTRTEVCDPDSSDLKTEEDTSFLENEERLRRQEELKQKMQIRRNQEKRQQEYELKLKREAENEANERKLMEREEKAVRLQLKILRRRSKEGKIRQVTADQRREERERLAMTREERHVRLHIKFCVRQHTKKRQLATPAGEPESQPPSTSSSRHERQKSAVSKTRNTKSASKKAGHNVSSDDDGDMSFLDINFTIPSSMKTRKQLSNNNIGRSQSKKTTVQKERATGGKIKRKSTSGRIPGRVVTPAPPEDLEDDCGYGDEFDDVVDEAALGHLIC